MSAAIAPMIGIVMLEIAKIGRGGGTQSRAQIDEATVGDYAEVLEHLPPSIVFYDGTEHWLADGFHRIAAYEQSGQTEAPVEVRQGTLREAVLYSVGANATHGLRRSNADKRRAVETLLRDDEWARKSDRWIGERCGVHGTFVGRVRSELLFDSSSDGAPVTRIGQDGKERRMPTPSIASAVEEHIASTPPPPAEQETDEHLPVPVSQRDDYDSEEWYTPVHYIDDVRAVLHEIDLDPASCALAQSFSVGAKVFYGKDDDDPKGERSGLVKPWRGIVFLNPPYSRPGKFVEKLLASIEAGDVPAAIVLVNNQTDAAWFQKLLARADACCFARKRIEFLKPDGKPERQTRQGQAFVFIGTEAGCRRGVHAYEFERTFADHGVIVRATKISATTTASATTAQPAAATPPIPDQTKEDRRNPLSTIPLQTPKATKKSSPKKKAKKKQPTKKTKSTKR